MRTRGDAVRWSERTGGRSWKPVMIAGSSPPTSSHYPAEGILKMGYLVLGHGLAGPWLMEVEMVHSRWWASHWTTRIWSSELITRNCDVQEKQVECASLL